MVKKINIRSFLQAKESLTEDGFRNFSEYYGVDIRDAEIIDLQRLVKELGKVGCGSKALDGFYVGYKIPQIGKEFDLLRFGKDSVINIELKSSSSVEKIKKQLLRNKYYLGFLGVKVCAFTFVSDSSEIYHLNDGGELESTDLNHLVDALVRQELAEVEVPDNLFNPSDYLVSPFNSTLKFLADEYFLTNQQEDVKSRIIEAARPPVAAKFFSIMGSAGTGKTLLTFDVAKSLLISGNRVLIIHCGQLNAGHEKLRMKGWDIVAIRDYANRDFSKYEAIIVDEAQRIYERQLNEIIEKVNSNNCFCVFSHDRLQILANWEESRSEKIESIAGIVQYKLSEKIRTNKQIAEFIKLLFSNKKTYSISTNGNIEINYFGNTDDAKNYLDSLNDGRWEVLRFTPSQYNKEHHEKYFAADRKTSHQIIGQEFDGVVVTIDNFFSYDGNGELVYTGRVYYDPVKMLFQNITRTRKKLNLVIIGNEGLLSRCIKILQ